MAHSVVKVTDIKDDELNDSLLLLVGEDGTVAPDQDTVETFLKHRNGPTNIQIMKINKTEKQGIDISVDNVTYMPDAVNEEVVKSVYEMDEVARNLYSFRLDHDYTPLTSPRRSSSSHEEDELVKTLSILDGPDTDAPIPSIVTSEPPPLILTNQIPDKVPPRVKIIQSITITPANTQTPPVNRTCAIPSQPLPVSSVSTPLTNASNVKIIATFSPGSSTPAASTAAVTPTVKTPTAAVSPEVSKPTPITYKAKAKIIKTEPKTAPRVERGKLVKPKPTIAKEIVEEESDDDLDEEDFDFEIEDDENDSDFDFEEEMKVKQTPKRVGRRARSDQAVSPKSPKLTPKARSKENKVGKEFKQESPKAEVKEKEKEKKVQDEKAPEKSPEKVPEQKPEQVEVKPPEKKPPKKEKKVPKPILDDFALFSTPDIIRRVGGKEPTTPSTPEANSPTKPGKMISDQRSKSIESPQSPTKHNKSSLDGKPSATEKPDKDKHSNHHHSDGKSKERRISTGDSKKRPSVDEKSNKVDQSKSEKHEPKKAEKSSSKSTDTTNSSSLEEIPSAEDIRSIIMNEDTKSYTTNTLPLDLNNSSSQNMDPNNINLDATGLDIDPTLLDNLNNDEISEDILYQVAQSLVSNPELQNAIDKGINDGVLDPMGVDHGVMSNQMSMVQEPSDVIQKGTQIVRPDGRIVLIPPIERPTTRSRNKRREEAKPPFKPVHKPLDDEHVSGNELDSSNDEEESEDDPNKLWCICNQPHNNRFMICCDTCEEWYHGKCVNITKTMGQQMEAEGKEWICLFCKDPMLSRPQAAARRVRKASRTSRTSTDSADSSTKKADVSSGSVPCVVCQKPSRKSSIYCSEACILAHAQGFERVVVFERSTGNMLTGNKAPSAANLEQWLKEHPGYEVVRSRGKVVTSKAGSFTQSKLKLVKNPDDEGVSLAIQKKGVSVGVLKHSPKHPSQQTKTTLKATITGIKLANKVLSAKEPKTKLIQPQPIPKPAPAVITPTKPKPTLPTPTKSPQVVQSKPKTPTTKEKVMPAKTPKARQQEQAVFPPPPKPQENIRENVQKTVFEQLTNRLKSCDDLKLTEDEVKNISNEIESQLYKCFGDTGQKYRNKYRSLIFNIKDVKNQTLWRRICEKSINPYELVRLSPDDMASQELAMWREREAKHQLDMIKKSELELLNCNRQYVLKTHKGEQVVEDDRTDKTDNTEVIKSLTEGSTLESAESKTDSSKDRDKKSSSKHSHRDKDRDRHRDKERKSSKEKEHRSHRSSSKDRDRDRERSRKRSRSRDRSSRHSDHKKRSRSRERHRKSSHKSSRHKKDIISTTEKLDKKSKEILEQLVDNKIVPPLEDRLWKHVPQEDIVPAAESDSDHEPSSTVTIPTPPRSQESDDFSISQTPEIKNSLSLSDKEKDSSPPEERSTSPPPRSQPAEIWRGTINMIDVAQISITAHEVSGDCSGLGKELPENLDIVGRISPDTVWDYIGKMKCSNSKIISLLRLNATNIEEKMPYLALYSYLSSRTRLGVVKSMNKAVKDFYILPLAPQKPIPQALLPLNGPGFEESRPALLLGIIVRDKRKRPHIEPILPSPLVSKRNKVETPPLPVAPPSVAAPSRSYTPPPLKDPRLKLPLPPALPIAGDEDDEPYSPEDSDPEAPAPLLMPIPQTAQATPPMVSDPIVPTPTYPAIPGLSATPNLPSSTVEIQRQMEELNKKIEMQKSEITSMTQNIVSASSEIGSSALANIALPSNLQQILDSIKTIGETTESVSSSPQETSQADLTIPLMIPKTFTRPLSSMSQRLDMPSDTIPLNLPSKPKIKPATVNSPLLEEKGSVLGSLSEEELIRKAAEMLGEEEKPKRKPEKEMAVSMTPPKRPKVDISLPPVPGLEDEIL